MATQQSLAKTCDCHPFAIGLRNPDHYSFCGKLPME